jgi:N-acetylmuramoyl-L-alanine amidase
MVVPLACLLLCAFSGRIDPVRGPKKTITVVIDAGHGGWDDGAVASNGLKEKNINLSLAQMVKRLAPQYGVNVVLTRDADVLSGGLKSRQASLHYRANLAGEKKADLFISLHADAGSGANEAGFHIYVTKENAHFQQSARLGDALIDALKSCYSTGNELKETQEHVYVLRAATVPAVIVLCGNIDNERDRAYISNISNQEKIARGILEGVVHYNP